MQHEQGWTMKVDALRLELQALRATWAYAFANGHGCTLGASPTLQYVHTREADLLALIAEHEEG